MSNAINPMAMEMSQRQVVDGRWTSGLFECTLGGLCSTRNICSVLCPCCMIGKNTALLDMRADLTGGGDCCDWLMGLPNMEFENRRRVRLISKIPQAPCEDMACVICCLPFVICQNQREIKMRAGPQGIIPTMVRMMKK
jgi:Cys-rich protein (TIGR01571 family)